MEIEEIENRKDKLEEKMETLLNTFIVETDVSISEVYTWISGTKKWVVAIDHIREAI